MNRGEILKKTGLVRDISNAVAPHSLKGCINPGTFSELDRLSRLANEWKESGITQTNRYLFNVKLEF